MAAPEEEGGAVGCNVARQLEDLDAAFVNGFDHTAVTVSRGLGVQVIFVDNTQQTFHS